MTATDECQLSHLVVHKLFKVLLFSWFEMKAFKRAYRGELLPEKAKSILHLEQSSVFFSELRCKHRSALGHHNN